MKITTLIEDTKKDDHVVSEFGLSLHIETNGIQILLDTGRIGGIVPNSKALGIDLKKVDAVVISHAHADHGGGLGVVLQRNITAPVYLHANCDKAYYGNIGARLPIFLNRMVHPLVKRSKLFSKYIGLDQDLLEQHKERIQRVSQTTEISKNIFLIANIQNMHPKPLGNKFLLTQKDGRIELDDFRHELILVVQEEDGLVIFSGCCHNGILNMLAAVASQFHDHPIKAVVGGFHLKLRPEKDDMAGTKGDVYAIADAFTKYDIHKIITGHCTGNKAYALLKEKLYDRVERLYTGFSIQI